MLTIPAPRNPSLLPSPLRSHYHLSSSQEERGREWGRTGEGLGRSSPWPQPLPAPPRAAPPRLARTCCSRSITAGDTLPIHASASSPRLPATPRPAPPLRTLAGNSKTHTTNPLTSLSRFSRGRGETWRGVAGRGGAGEGRASGQEGGAFRSGLADSFTACRFAKHVIHIIQTGRNKTVRAGPGRGQDLEHG